MSEYKQQSRVIVAAVALTFLLAGAGAGGWGVYAWWEKKISDPQWKAEQNATHVEARKPTGRPAAPVRVGKARREPVQPAKRLVGRLRAIHRTTIGSEVEGKVLVMNVEEGSPVQAGKTVLASIDKTWLKLARRKQQASIEVITALLRKEKANLDRLEEFRKQKVTTEREYGDQLAAYQQKVAELKEAQAALDDLDEKWKRLDIVATFSGWVIRRHVDTGQWLKVGSPVVDIVSRGQIYAEMSVPESLVSGLKHGMPINVTIDVLGRTFPGKIAAITPYGSTASRTYPVRVELSDENGLLMVGMSATAIFPAGISQEQITVSRDAVIIKPDGATVWVARGDPLIASPVAVEVLTRLGERYSVKPLDPSGVKLLTDGAEVILEGAERLKPDQAIRYMDRDLADAKWLGDTTETQPSDKPAKNEQ
ncbi:MAG: efflux RND transporter periplasmic adaptor subunit [Phycisphaerales bacterium]|jgi:RND family efflux transporter MFP subunit|nr:efflux RND transporter periplasmic adaptor subunit [Phycisphaerales bacterium]